MTVSQWSTTGGSNATVNDGTYGNIGLAEGQAPDTVNDSIRNLMAHVAAWYTRAGKIYYGVNNASAANAHVITVSGDAPAAYAAGQVFVWIAGATNTSNTVTLAVNALAATAVKCAGGAVLGIGAIQSGGLYAAVHDGTDFELLNPRFETILRTASASAELEFTGLVANAVYELYFDSILPATDNVDLTAIVGTAAGGYDTTAASYRSSNIAHADGVASASVVNGGGSVGYWLMANVVNNDANYGMSGRMTLFTATGTNLARAVWQFQGYTGAAYYTYHGGGHWLGPIDQIKILFSAGNIASGTIKLARVA